MISPYFVPMNYVGAKRPLHFCRHLPAHGWRPAVVALPAEIERDPALDALVPDVPLLRTLRGGPTAWLEDVRDRLSRPGDGLWQYTAQGKTAEARPPKGPLEKALREISGTLGTFDRFTKHIPWALPGILRFAREHRCEAVYANAGPFSALLLAGAVHRLSGLPMVLDLRDPWSLEPNYRASWTAGGRRLVDALEAAHFRRARKVILNTASAHQAYVRHYAGRLPEGRFTFIRNQFDPELYVEPGPAPRPGEPFRIIYFGHLRPTKNADLFLLALSKLVAAEGLTPDELELVMLGEVSPRDREVYARLGLSSFVHLRDWLPFTRSPELLGTADVLLDLQGPNHSLQVSGKFYDYLAAGRPILTLSPNPEMDEMYATCKAGSRVPLSVDAVVDALRDRYARRFEPWAPDAAGVVTFGAKAATARFAEVLDEVVR